MYVHSMCASVCSACGVRAAIKKKTRKKKETKEKINKKIRNIPKKVYARGCMIERAWPKLIALACKL